MAEPGADGQVAALVQIENVSDAPFAGRLQFEADGRAVEAEARVGPRATGRVALHLVLPGARLWSPEATTLYDAHVRLFGAGGEIDSVADRFGVRSIEARGRQILLNGRPLRIRGVNRYDEFPDRGPVADEAAIRADLEAVKATGANLVRVHYPQAPAHLRIADEIGLLYMEEVPLNWWRASRHPPVPPEFENDRIIDVAERALEQMVRRDGNHPSLVVWSMANECQTADQLGIRAMERLLRRAKTLDPTRLSTYVANRSLEKNRAFALADFVAVNLYFGMWDGPVAGDIRFSENYQAAYLSAAWRAVEAVPEVSGGVVWCWADYRHRHGFTNEVPTYFGPFGIVTFDRRPKKAHAALRALWTSEFQPGD